MLSLYLSNDTLKELKMLIQLKVIVQKHKVSHNSTLPYITNILYLQKTIYFVDYFRNRSECFFGNINMFGA